MAALGAAMIAGRVAAAAVMNDLLETLEAVLEMFRVRALAIGLDAIVYVCMADVGWRGWEEKGRNQKLSESNNLFFLTISTKSKLNPVRLGLLGRHRLHLAR